MMRGGRSLLAMCCVCYICTPAIIIRSIAKKVLLLSFFALATGGCGKTNQSEARFVEFCNNFEFVDDRDKRRLEGLREGIRSGSVDVHNGVSVEIMANNALSTQKVDGLNVDILNLEVSAPGIERFSIRIPQAKISDSNSFSISSPKYRDVDCFSVRKKTYFDFLQKDFEQ